MSEAGAIAVDTFADFAQALRREGVNASMDRLKMLFEALASLPGAGLDTLFRCSRLTLCTRHQDLAVHDRLFGAFFLRLPQIGDDPAPAPPALRPGSARVQQRGAGEDEQEEEVQVGAASDAEHLRYRNITTLTEAERAQIYALIACMRARVEMRTSRRSKPGVHGQLDVRRIVRSALASGGEPKRLFRCQRRARPRKRVLLIDISGSMAPYAGGLLRLAYAAAACAPRTTEVFTIGTRLTRITPHIALDDPQAAILAASRAIPDWSGGTRLGDQLKAFIDLWGQRGMARGATLLIASDGWERGSAGLLAAQMRRLRRLAHRIIWANPHRSTPGFQPLTAGMQAALPSVHDFIGGSTAAELQDLLHKLGGARTNTRKHRHA